MRARRAAVFLAAAVLGLGTLARADEVIFNNGDKLTGKIESADGGKLVITTKVAGKITIDLKDVKTFSTDAPVAVKLQDGTVLKQQIATSTTAGDIATAPGGVLQPQAVPISSIDKINEPPPAWTGSLVINGEFARGNSSSDQIGISANVSRDTDRDRLSADGAYLYGRSTPQNGTSSTTEDNEYIEGEYDYKFTKKFFGYVASRVEKDRINLLDLRLTPGAGIGYHWIDQPDLHFETEGGLAWVYEKFSNINTPNEDFSVRLAYHIDKSLWSDKVKLFHDLQAFPSIDNISHFLVITDAGFHVDLTEKMFSEVKATVNYDNAPAPGSARTSAKVLVGVGWTF